MKRPRTYTEEDDEGNDVEVITVLIELKTVEDGEPMVKAVLGKKGEDVLTTQNWVE